MKASAYNLQKSISLFSILLTGPIFTSGKVPIPKSMELCTSLLDRLPDSGQLSRPVSILISPYLERKPKDNEVKKVFIIIFVGLIVVFSAV